MTTLRLEMDRLPRRNPLPSAQGRYNLALISLTPSPPPLESADLTPVQAPPLLAILRYGTVLSAAEGPEASAAWFKRARKSR